MLAVFSFQIERSWIQFSVFFTGSQCLIIRSKQQQCGQAFKCATVVTKCSDSPALTILGHANSHGKLSTVCLALAGSLHKAAVLKYTAVSEILSDNPCDASPFPQAGTRKRQCATICVQPTLEVLLPALRSWSSVQT